MVNIKTALIGIILYVLACTSYFGQTVLKGTLLDSITKQPIEFANIGLVGKGAGTVSNEKGEYNFSIPDSLQNSIIKFSLIGYKPRVLSAKKLGSLSTVYMAQDVKMLNEVKVSSKKLKIKIKGNNTLTKNTTVSFQKNGLGCEMAIRLDVKHAHTQLRRLMLNIANNSTGAIPVFRFNIYKIDKEGYPKDNILTSNIIFEPKDTTGLMDVDLKPYNIYVDEDVFIAVEWIKDLGQNGGSLAFSAEIFGYHTYARKASHDTWMKFPVGGVGLHAEIGY